MPHPPALEEHCGNGEVCSLRLYEVLTLITDDPGWKFVSKGLLLMVLQAL